MKQIGKALLFASTLSIAACSTGTEPEATLALATAPDFSATVSKVWFEGGNGPAGPYSQYNVWLAIPPTSSTNAGVVVPTTVPVFARSGSGRLTAAKASDIRVGSIIEVWHDRSLSHGAVENVGVVQGPPGAPTYSGVQIVIER